MSCPSCADSEKEAALYAQTLASVSAALLGVLQPGMPYEGNRTSVAEAMQVRRALSILASRVCGERARGRYDIEAGDVAEEILSAIAVATAEIKVVYAKEEPKEIGYNQSDAGTWTGLERKDYTKEEPKG